MNNIKKRTDKNSVSRGFILVLLILIIFLSVVGTISILLSVPNANTITNPIFQKSSSSAQLSFNIEKGPSVVNEQAHISFTVVKPE